VNKIIDAVVFGAAALVMWAIGACVVCAAATPVADISQIGASLERQAARIAVLESDLDETTRQRNLALNIAARACLRADRVYAEALALKAERSIEEAGR